MDLHIGTKEQDWADVVEGQLSVDIFETEDQIIIQSAIAGVSASDLDLFVNADMVTIRGTRQRDARTNTATMHYEECFWGAFSRTVVLPSHIKPGDAQAELKDGILTITLPKEHKGGASIPVTER
ncbi:heat-shock protein Hsp20 [Candidatus Uhrbacteria bacterium CG10_big_fil_rev_8_21_14_0_10_50_16]|uniref:Heat-shock protein Hsp20 n=1 Tax=Candidatus Uhrbacteria bacterium CG10_big_fil_rev_8_21_14_0_10_50_16 TaxID=1975039 RepID=A0A2H0RMQ3_9BACT|nr:MAG: heat-shock protein Hsp20 [Candidatus Uhrbacteria bacterium CG10_big_fil_rev_8_21_14_0_10_50_16]